MAFRPGAFSFQVFYSLNNFPFRFRCRGFMEHLMNSKIRVGIVGYGNLGRGVESAIKQNPDMRLVGVFTRRDPATVTLDDPDTPVHALDRIEGFVGAIDVLILCGGSKNDLPEQGPALARRFCTVDSFDTHARIPDYFEAVDAQAKSGSKTAMIS